MPSNFNTIKKLLEKILIPENCQEICVPKLNREIFFSKDFQPWIKRADKRIRDTQTGAVKVTATLIKVSEEISSMLRENYIINTKEVLSAALDGVILLGNVSHSLNNLRKEKLKPTFIRDLQHLCDSSNSVTSHLLAKETARITLSQKPQKSHNNGGYNSQNEYSSNQLKQFQNSSSFSSKHNFLAAE